MSHRPPEVDFSAFIGKVLGTDVTEDQIKAHANGPQT